MKLISRRLDWSLAPETRLNMNNWRELSRRGAGAAGCRSVPVTLGVIQSGSAEISSRAFQRAQNEDWPPFNLTETPLSVFGRWSFQSKQWRNGQESSAGLHRSPVVITRSQ